MKPDYEHISQFDREELKLLADEIQKACSRRGKHMKKGGIANEVTLSLFHTAVAVNNFASLNGTMQIWASFTPVLFGAEDYVEPTPISE